MNTQLGPLYSILDVCREIMNCFIFLSLVSLSTNQVFSSHVILCIGSHIQVCFRTHINVLFI